METTQAVAGHAHDAESPFRIDFTFVFGEPWIIVPERNGKSKDLTPDGGGMVPPGGGLHQKKRSILIGPVHLDGLSPEQVIEVTRQRAEEMTLLSDALAVSNTEYSKALDRYTNGRPTSGQG